MGAGKNKKMPVKQKGKGGGPFHSRVIVWKTRRQPTGGSLVGKDEKNPRQNWSGGELEKKAGHRGRKPKRTGKRRGQIGGTGLRTVLKR